MQNVCEHKVLCRFLDSFGVRWHVLQCWTRLWRERSVGILLMHVSKWRTGLLRFDSKHHLREWTFDTNVNYCAVFLVWWISVLSDLEDMWNGATRLEKVPLHRFLGLAFFYSLVLCRLLWFLCSIGADQHEIMPSKMVLFSKKKQKSDFPPWSFRNPRTAFWF